MEDFLKMVESVIVWVTVYGSLIVALVLIFTRKPAPQSVEKETTDAVPTPKHQSGVAVPLVLPCPVAIPDDRSRTTKDNEQDACFAEASHLGSDFDPVEINPVSGLPMIDGIVGVDVAGNPYGSNDDLFYVPHFGDDW